jgi:dTDP-4-dehydrorhamnose 3,5-epimerase
MNKKSKLTSGQKLFNVELTPINEHKDERGLFSEIFCNEWSTAIDPLQWSAVKSNRNVLRGMHLHLRHDEYFCLIKGHCLVALKDIRPDSATKGGFSIYELFDSDLAALTFPRGIIHGWYFFEKSIHIQAVSESYSDYKNDDNWGILWNAKNLDIPWPAIDPIISKRASEFSDVNQLNGLISNLK